MAAEPDSIAGPTILVMVIGGGVIYVFGYARAVMHRAGKDYKATKAAVPGLRKQFWRALWTTTKVGFWVFIAFALFVTWAVHQ